MDSPADSSLSSAPPDRNGPWTEITALSDRAYRVRLGGPFGPGWLSNLCQGVAAHQISIGRAHAMRAHNRSWMAELHVVALPGATDPKHVPYLSLTAGVENPVRAPLMLTQYELQATDDHGGTLKLTFEAQDTVGLLGSLLAQIATVGLYPIEMHIETRGDCACDCLWLGTLGPASPSREMQERLEGLLQQALSKS